MIKPHPDFNRFFGVLTDPGFYAAWTGNVWRQSMPRFVSLPYRFTGAGSVLAGGRWSVKELMPTVYASTDPGTLHAEAYHKGRRYGWTAADLKAQTVIGMHWELQVVLDLTNAATLRALKVSRTAFLNCDWNAEQKAGNEPVTQAIARAAFENRAEGLIVHSARKKGGIDIIYFPSHRRDGTLIQTPDEANIPFIHGLQ